MGGVENWILDFKSEEVRTCIDTPTVFLAENSIVIELSIIKKLNISTPSQIISILSPSSSPSINSHEMIPQCSVLARTASSTWQECQKL